jgi:hypothetical protein
VRSVKHLNGVGFQNAKSKQIPELETRTGSYTAGLELADKSLHGPMSTIVAAVVQ